MQTAEIVPMNCPKCGQAFNFPSEGLGQTAPCPHCNADIVLRPLPVENPETPKRHERSRVKVYRGGMEGRLDTLGLFSLFIGIGGGLIMLLAGCLGEKINGALCILGAESIAAGLVVASVLKALAEIIRLLNRDFTSRL